MDLPFRIGSDVGGTFTDSMLLDTESGSISIDKRLTTPRDPSDAVLDALYDFIEHDPRTAAQLRHVIHGTTLAINAVIERRGARTALITTTGFRDVLEMRRHLRNSVYDITDDPQTELVAREHRFEVDERLASDGRVLRKLDAESLLAVCDELERMGAESVAVSFLHAYAHPHHEREAKRILTDRLPGLPVSISSEVAPEIREYERTSTTSINAYTMPMVSRYLNNLQRRLFEAKTDANLFVMHSGGGLIGHRAAGQYPVRIMESGPVAGVLAAGFIGREVGESGVIAFDMGGTTAKACALIDGKLPITAEFEIDRAVRFKKGTGLPISVPTVDLVEIGAGGGSIAGINERGLLGVGPRSSGAFPGPACYGLGGESPTVTDADLVLGYLNPAYFLGGRMRLREDLAKRAILDRVGARLGVGLNRAAWGIYDVVNESMASALREYLAERGLDIRKVALVATGGAGPVHAYGVARKIEIRKIIVPQAAGVASAFGLLAAPISYQSTRTYKRPFDLADSDVVRDLCYGLKREVDDLLAETRPEGDVAYQFAVDMCYLGQTYAISLPIEVSAGLPRDLLTDAFLRSYEAQYGYAYDDMPLELVRIRLRAEVETEPIKLRVARSRTAGASGNAPKGRRRAMDPRTQSWIEFPVYERASLAAGFTLAGPALIEEPECTTLVGSDATVSVTEQGHLKIAVGEVNGG